MSDDGGFPAGLLVGAAAVAILWLTISMARIGTAEIYPYGDQSCVVQRNEVLRCYMTEAE